MRNTSKRDWLSLSHRFMYKLKILILGSWNVFIDSDASGLGFLWSVCSLDHEQEVYSFIFFSSLCVSQLCYCVLSLPPRNSSPSRFLDRISVPLGLWTVSLWSLKHPCQFWLKSLFSPQSRWHLLLNFLLPPFSSQHCILWGWGKKVDKKSKQFLGWLTRWDYTLLCWLLLPLWLMMTNSSCP